MSQPKCQICHGTKTDVTAVKPSVAFNKDVLSCWLTASSAMSFSSLTSAVSCSVTPDKVLRWELFAASVQKKTSKGIGMSKQTNGLRPPLVTPNPKVLILTMLLSLLFSSLIFPRISSLESEAFPSLTSRIRYSEKTDWRVCFAAQETSNEKQCRGPVGATSSPNQSLENMTPYEEWRTWPPPGGEWRQWPPPVENGDGDPLPPKTMNIHTQASLPCQATKVRLPNGSLHN